MAQTALETMGNGEEFFLVIFQLQQVIEKYMETHGENEKLKLMQKFCEEYAKNGQSVFQLIPGDMEKLTTDILVKNKVGFAIIPDSRGNVIVMVEPKDMDKLTEAIQYANDKSPQHSSQLLEDDITKTGEKVIYISFEKIKENNNQEKNQGKGDESNNKRGGDISFFFKNKEVFHEILASVGTPIADTIYDGEKPGENNSFNNEISSFLVTTNSCKNGLLLKGMLECATMNAVFKMGNTEAMKTARVNEVLTEQAELNRFLKNITGEQQKDCFLSAGLGGNLQASFDVNTQKVTIERLQNGVRDTLIDIPLSQLKDLAKKEDRDWETLLKNKLLDATKGMAFGTCFEWEENSKQFEDREAFEKVKKEMFFDENDPSYEEKSEKARRYTEKLYEDRRQELTGNDGKSESLKTAYQNTLQGRGEEIALERKMRPFKKALLGALMKQIELEEKINPIPQSANPFVHTKAKMERMSSYLDTKDAPFLQEIMQNPDYQVTMAEREKYIDELGDSLMALATLQVQEVKATDVKTRIEELEKMSLEEEEPKQDAESKKENAKEEDKEHSEEHTKEEEEEEKEEGLEGIERTKDLF